MFDGHRIGVVVPAFNEEGFVTEVIRTIPDFVDHVYVIDDASTDETWAEINRMVDQLEDGANRLDTIRHETNRGVGAAIKTGYRRAIEDRLDVVAVMAGDGQMDPAYLDAIIDPVIEGRAAYAKGNRFHRRTDRSGMSRWRVFGNGILTLLTRASSGYWQMTDPQNGYTAIDVGVLETIELDDLFDRYGFANDLLAVLNADQHRIVDVAHPAVYGDEHSDIRYASFVPTLSWLLLRRFLWRLKTRYLVRGFHPLVLCYPVGIGAFVTGLAALSFVIATSGSLVEGLLSTTVLLLGILFLIFAMWFDIDANDALVGKDERPHLFAREVTDPTDVAIESAKPRRGPTHDQPVGEIEGVSR